MEPRALFTLAQVQYDTSHAETSATGVMRKSGGEPPHSKSEAIMLVSFRPCGPKDHSKLLKLVCAYYRFDKIPYDRRSLSKGLDTLLRNVSQGQTWLMENHKKAVGYAVLTYNFDLEYGGVEGMLTDLYVDKRYRHKGIGSLALFEIEDFCRERGIRAIELQVQHHNRAAETFYRKAGFQVLKRKVMLMAVRPEEVTQPLRAIASKRR